MSYQSQASGSQRQIRAVNSGKSPVYAIDFSAVACGSRIASTKRKIRWRFGFTNLEALDAGLTGQECRGEEHEIQLVWSITSGKRVVHVDNKEIHYSNNRGSTFEFSWTMRGNHVLKIVANASAPITATKGFRQYNFYVDGLSFFSFPKVYRLNIPGREVSNYAPSTSSNQGVGYPPGEEPSWKLEEPRTEQEEEAILKEIIEESLKEKEKAAEKEKEKSVKTEEEEKPSADTTADLLDFFSVPAVTTPAPTNSGSSVISQQTNGTASYAFAQTSGQNPQAGVATVAAATVNAYATPAPAPSTYPTPIAHATYSTPIAPAAYSNPSHAPAPSVSYQTPAAAIPQYNAVTPGAQPTQVSATLPTTVNPNATGSLADQAYNKIANDFSLLTTADTQEKARSNPFETPSTVTGPAPTLEGLKSSKPEMEKKEVMKTPAAGAMVVAGNQQGNWSGYSTAYTNPGGTGGQGYYVNQAAPNGVATTQPMSYGNYNYENNYATYASQQTQYTAQQQIPAQQYPNMQAQYQNQQYYQQYQPTQP